MTRPQGDEHEQPRAGRGLGERAQGGVEDLGHLLAGRKEAVVGSRRRWRCLELGEQSLDLLVVAGQQVESARHASSPCLIGD